MIEEIKDFYVVRQFNYDIEEIERHKWWIAVKNKRPHPFGVVKKAVRGWVDGHELKGKVTTSTAYRHDSPAISGGITVVFLNEQESQ